MCHTSPATYLVWSTFSTVLLAFLLYHLWSFDKFKCLKWNSGPYSGAFKRVMTYSYLLSVPLIWVYSLGFAIIKYRAGFIFLPGKGSVQVFPAPFTTWDPTSRAALFPLTLMFSIAWALEMVTHLEELCFWYFLLNAGTTQRDWFRTWHFRLWVTGSVVALLVMPLVTIFTRSDPLTSEAYLFLTGSLGSLTITIWFLPILWLFPSFLEILKDEGVDTATIVRLTKFNELNRLRVSLRFCFICPLLILGVDGVRPQHILNESMTVTDILVTVSGLGCVLSSAMTLVIFFPRSVESEIAERDAAMSRKWSSSRQDTTQNFDSSEWGAQSRTSEDSHGAPAYAHDQSSKATLDKAYEMQQHQGLPPLRPNRRKGAEVELGNMDQALSQNTSRSQSRSRYSVNPLIHNWKSPLEFGQYPTNRLTFQRPVNN